MESRKKKMRLVEGTKEGGRRNGKHNGGRRNVDIL